MRIIKVNIEANAGNLGLKSIKMDRLGQVVLVAGKNGSGKSRILKLVMDFLVEKPVKYVIDDYNNRLINDRRSLKILESDLEMYKRELATYEAKPNNQNREAFERTINNTIRDIDAYTEHIASAETILGWNILETDLNDNEYSFVLFVPKQLEIQNPTSFTRAGLLSTANGIDSLGVSHLHIGTFAKIQVLQDKWFNATHQDSTIGDEERKQILIDYDRLVSLIKLVLNVTIDRDADGDSTIFGFKLGHANLSDGQKILIQFCLAIHSQEKLLDHLILFLDEPENHLHPSVIIDIVERIKSAAPNGQIWIATHSVPLLSHFDRTHYGL